ncbi:MAG: hypothetical protein ACREUU_06065 [Gammaproteobacteria bacterium]
MKKTSAQFIEILHDPELRRKEKQVTEAVRRSHPQCGPIKLYRTADGRIGFQLQLRVAAGERQTLDDVYRIIMKVLGEKRGRRPGVRTVQTKLRLPETVYSALKKAAADSNATISSIVAELAQRELARGAPPSAG